MPNFVSGIMRQLIYIFILAALVCLGIGGCTPRRVGEAMNRADSLMTLAPDSALALLDAIDPATLRTDAARARHAVLLTRARHLADVPVYDDSIIAIGTDYYATHGSHAEKAEAFYMASIVNYYNKHYEQSIVDGLRAEKYALAASDHLLLGLVYRTIADGFKAMYDASSALHYYDLSYRSLRDAKSKKYAPWALIDLSRAYIMIKQNDTALIYSSQALDIADSIGNIDLKVAALREIAAALFYKGEYKKAIQHYEILRNISPSSFIEDDYENLGESYLLTGNNLKARECQDSLDAREYDLSELKIMLLQREGRFQSAYELKSHVLNWQNREVDKLFNRNYAATISSFYDKEAESNLRIVKKERRIRYLAISVGVLILLCGIIIYVYRTRILRQEKEMIMLEARDLRNILNEKESEVSEARSVSALAKENVRGLLASRFEILDRLCSTYFQFKGLSNERDKISNEVLSIISEIQNDRQILGNLESLVDTNLDGLMARLRRDVPGLKERDYELYLYLLLDFSPRAISILQGIRTEAVYNRKSVLKRKITESGSESTQEYLSHIL